MSTVVAAKVTHIGEDYATISMTTISNQPDVMDDIQVGRSVGLFLAQVGAYANAMEPIAAPFDITFKVSEQELSQALKYAGIDPASVNRDTLTNLKYQMIERYKANFSQDLADLIKDQEE